MSASAPEVQERPERGRLVLLSLDRTPTAEGAARSSVLFQGHQTEHSQHTPSAFSAPVTVLRTSEM